MTQNERMKFRRRAKSTIENKRNLNEVECDVDIGKTAADDTAGIWDETEISRNESSGLVDQEFTWKGKDPAPHIINPTIPKLENIELIRHTVPEPDQIHGRKIDKGGVHSGESRAEKRIGKVLLRREGAVSHNKQREDR